MTGAHRAESPEPARDTGVRETGTRDGHSPDELRGELGQLRAELGGTVEELAQRADVSSRVRAKTSETGQQVQAQVGRAREALAHQAPGVERTLRDQPAVVGGCVAVALGYLLLRTRRKRKRAFRKEADGTR